jgi:hypothetical protein
MTLELRLARVANEVLCVVCIVVHVHAQGLGAIDDHGT